MDAPRTNLSEMTQAVKSTSSQGPLAYPALRLVVCRRCWGLLVNEHCTEMELGSIGSGYWAKRCIQCGDMIDETILHNRCDLRHTLQEIGLAASPLHDREGGRYATISHASPTIRSPSPLRTSDTIR